MNDKANLDYEELMRKVKARQEDLTRKMNERPKPKRKVVQICQVAESEDQEGRITALCDDGSIWFTSDTGGWSRIEDIPQD